MRQQRQKTRSSQDENEKMCFDSVRKKVDHFLDAKFVPNLLANLCCDTAAAAAKILKVKESNWGLVEERGDLGVEQKMVSIARVAVVVVVVLYLYRKENVSVEC